MNTTHFFKSGDSHIGSEVVLRLQNKNVGGAFDALVAMPRDFALEDRRDQAPQEREGI